MPHTSTSTSRRLAALAAALALTLTACGGHHPAARPDTHTSSSQAAAPLASPDPVTPWASLDTAAGLAKAMHATGGLHRSQVIIAQYEADTTVNGVGVTLDRFADPDVLNTGVGMMSGLGVSVAVVNDHWTVSALNRPFLTRLAARYGWALIDTTPQD